MGQLLLELNSWDFGQLGLCRSGFSHRIEKRDESTIKVLG